MAAITKKKLDAMLRSAKARASSVAKGAGGVKESAFAAAGGVAAKVLDGFIPASITNDWLRVGIVAAAGHFLKKKHRAAGLGALGAAGANAYVVFRSKKPVPQASGLVFNVGPHNAFSGAHQAAALVEEASGVNDAGALYGAGAERILAAGAPRAFGRSSAEKINSL